MSCKCAEGAILVEGSSEPKPNNLNAHDCYYIDWRNGLIPEAERYADEVHNEGRHHGAWGLAFHHRMEELVKARRH